MIIDLTRKGFVPESYQDSRDYQVFLIQLSMLLTVFKYNIDNLATLYSPEDCPDDLLTLLSTMLGYKYTEEKSISSNRKIMTYFPYLLRYRGSEKGIKLAIVLSINTDPDITRPYSTDNIIIDVDRQLGLIRIYYPNVDVIDWTLIETVRPVGMRLKFIKSDIAKSKDELDLKVSATSYSHNEEYDKSTVDQSQVGFDVTT